MLIDGKEIANVMYADLQKRVGELKEKEVTPHLAVILVGDDPASVAYVNQKRKSIERIGGKISILNFPITLTTEQLMQTIHQLNTDDSVHAILVQKPLPNQIDIPLIDKAILPKKDIDGFNSESKFILPLPLAVRKLLEEVYKQISQISPVNHDYFLKWLQAKSIVIIGKGPTAGGPTISYLEKLGIHPIVIDSKTSDKQTLIKQADIVISSVGKDQVITAENIKKGVILISVGMHKGSDEKLKSDYDEEQIQNIASFYTPTPGGVGPVNVACLMQNVITATEEQTKLII